MAKGEEAEMVTMMKNLDDCKGGVVAAAPESVKFHSGTELLRGDLVMLPKVAGGGSGIVDKIVMMVNADEEVTFAVRVVDREGKGHTFLYEGMI